MLSHLSSLWSYESQGQLVCSLGGASSTDASYMYMKFQSKRLFVSLQDNDKKLIYKITVTLNEGLGQQKIEKLKRL